MIRINLLSEGRRPVVARKSKPKLGLGNQDPSLLFLIGGLVLGLLISGGWIYALNSDLDVVKGKIKKAKKEVKELEPILKEVKAFKQKKEELNTKITLISDLNAKRKGPVFVMDEVSRALPDLVWLRSMNVKGKTVSLNGTAFNTNAVATFIENLALVPEFKEPDTKNVQRSNRGKTYSFRISFRYELPKPPPVPDAVEEEVDQPAA
ncbi:MAG: PilN domain-containing protein [Acidobacteriota bacterium]